MRTHGEDCSPTGTWADTNWWVCRCPTHHPHKPWWNRADSVLCEFSGCNTARPEQKPQQTASTAVSLEEKKWRCPSCSLVNPIREFYCTRCRLHHPSRRYPSMNGNVHNASAEMHPQTICATGASASSSNPTFFIPLRR